MLAALPAGLRHILSSTPELRRSYLVGGCVRDALLGIPVKDHDVEVFGVTYEALAAALARHGRTDLVGRSFGVVKLTLPGAPTYDFTVPRRDSKVSSGHKGFEITTDPDLSPAEAAARRDYTCNALMVDAQTGALLDFFGGVPDLQQGILRHTSAAFTEDPLRVLRGLQFAGRFGFTAAPETAALCREIQHTHAELASERIREEWSKWAARSEHPSAGLRFLRETGWLENYPELAALIDVPQEPEWHPEGDVFVHTGLCLDALVRLPEWRAADEASRIAWSLAVLAHDLGKPSTTTRAVRDGRERIVSNGHEEAGGALAGTLLARMAATEATRKRVLPLVGNHLAHLQAITDRAVRRLALRLEPETIEGLAVIIRADSAGRPPLPPEPHGLAALLETAQRLQLQAARPRELLQGRHLVELGMKPGATFKVILGAAFEAQLDGAFFDLDGAKRWLATAPVPLPDEARARLR
jgi:tRNA nucleotidyltransferase (CCA-adding enzyme)